jgi:hypothetical protein
VNAALWAELKRELVADIAAEVVQRMQAGAPGWTDQSASPLGRRRHCCAVKSRVAAGQPGASIVGRRHLLSPESLLEELERASGKPKAAPAAAGGVAAELRAEIAGLRVVR